MFVTSYSVTYCIYVPGKLGICFHYYCAVYDECKYSDTFWLADHTRLFVQYTISLSSLCKLIWRHWTYKMPVRYILSSVWVRLSIFSPLSILQYMGLYVFSLPISFVMIERTYIICLIIIIKLEVWTITHCKGLGHETMVSAVCLSIFLYQVVFEMLFCVTFLISTFTQPSSAHSLHFILVGPTHSCHKFNYIRHTHVPYLCYPWGCEMVWSVLSKLHHKCNLCFVNTNSLCKACYLKAIYDLSQKSHSSIQ